MANKEHVQALTMAIASMSMAPWNLWRIENPNILPDFLGVELVDINLSFAYLSRADISHADLSRTNLHHATLQYTDLSLTSLRNADLSEADLSYSILKGADLTGAILRDANLRGANLSGASLKGADLRGANLADALVDPEAIEGQKRRSSGGVSRLEKLALGLFAYTKFARAKGKDWLLLVKGTAPPRSGNHI